jgi:hypothetical protein
VVSQCPGIHAVLEDEINVLRRIPESIHSRLFRRSRSAHASRRTG